MQPHGSSEAACQRGYASSHNTSSILRTGCVGVRGLWVRVA